MSSYKFETQQLHVGQETPDIATDVKSVVIHPATTTHSQLNEQELEEQNIAQSTIRLSIGTEHIDDILQDLEQAFKAVEEE